GLGGAEGRAPPPALPPARRGPSEHLQGFARADAGGVELANQAGLVFGAVRRVSQGCADDQSGRRVGVVNVPLRLIDQWGLLRGRRLRLRRAACSLGCLAASVVVAPPAPTSTHSPGPARTPSWTVYHDDPAGRGVAAGVGSVDTAARAWTSPTL